MAIEGLGLLSLFGSSASSTASPFSALTNSFRTYSFATDKHGRVILPTMADLKTATYPKDKLALATQLAQVIQVQADAATKTGLPNRVAQMTQQAKTVMDEVTSIVAGINADKPSDASASSDLLKPYQQSLASVLGTLHSVLTEVATLPKTTASTAKSTGDAIRQLDRVGHSLAHQAGLVWPTISSSAGTTGTRAGTILDPSKHVNIVA
jgi:hypothetical protein